MRNGNHEIPLSNKEIEEAKAYGCFTIYDLNYPYNIATKDKPYYDKHDHFSRSTFHQPNHAKHRDY